MNGNEFRRLIRKLARERDLNYQFDRHHGKGSHGTLYLGNRRTTVKRGEIGEDLLNNMLKQLGLGKRDIKK